MPHTPFQMPPGATELRSLTPAARLAAQDSAIAALRQGQVVLAPGDTGYFLLATPASPAAADLGRIAAPATLLCPTTAAALDLAAEATSVARKIIRLLSPGPAVFRVQMSESDLAAARAIVGVPPGLVDTGDALLVRVPGPSVSAALVARSDSPLCIWEPMDAQQRSIIDIAEAAAIASDVGIIPAIALSDAPPTAGGSHRRPTVIALDRAGGVRVLVEGAFEERYVMKQARLNVLMVCTGNTCRSPMAEAIARGIIAQGSERGPTITVSSAGSGAAGGSPHTPEGNEAVKSLGYTPTRTPSRSLTRQMIAEADVIYAMARSNLNAILALDPSARDRAELLDPEGEDVPDPIGMPQRAYNETAGRIERMIRQRLEEWRS